MSGRGAVNASAAPRDAAGQRQAGPGGYVAPKTCKVKTTAKGRRRVHELGADGKALCAAHNAAAHNNNYEPLGPGTVDCLRCARAMTS